MAVVCAALGHIALAASQESGATQAEAVSKPESESTLLSGVQVYNAVCVACHSPPGVGGAPALGDADAWITRIEQGMDTLIDHVLYGYSGSNGIMPRKGGRTDLSDKEIIDAIEYMLEQLDG